MGWLSMPRTSMGAHDTPKAYLDNQFTFTRDREDGSAGGLTVIASSCQANRVYYAAVQHHSNGIPGDIFAVVCLIRWTPRAKDGFVFAYKDLDETMGPCETDCPARILDLLTPTTREYALNWRKACRENLRLRARPITDGMRIKMAAPLTFTDGTVADEFIVVKKGASITLRKVDGHGRYRISNLRSRAWSPVITTTVHRCGFRGDRAHHSKEFPPGIPI